MFSIPRERYWGRTNVRVWNNNQTNNNLTTITKILLIWENRKPVRTHGTSVGVEISSKTSGAAWTVFLPDSLSLAQRFRPWKDEVSRHAAKTKATAAAAGRTRRRLLVDGQVLVQVRAVAALGEISGRVTVSRQYPLGGQQSLDAHGTPSVYSSRADAHLGTWNRKIKYISATRRCHHTTRVLPVWKTIAIRG